MVLRPFMQILLLLGMVLLLGAVMGTIGALLAVVLFDVGDLSTFTRSLADQSAHPYAFLWVQAFSALGAFVLPALIFVWMQNRSPWSFYGLRRAFNVRLAVLAVLVLFFSQSLITLTSEWNQQITIPDNWGPVGEWLRSSNQDVQAGYEALLNFQSFGHMLLTMLVVAVLPAVGEELIFRGGFQKLIENWLKRPHLAVWTAAAIFSLFHFQVFFFLPRLLLGAALGYLYLWSRNLWYPIIAHFFNNAWVIVMAYFFLPEGGTTELLAPEQQLPMPALITGSLAFVGFLLLFRWTAKRHLPNEVE